MLKSAKMNIMGEGLVEMDFARIAEEKIKQGYEEGAFNHLAGFGKPIKLDHLEGLPEELRMVYTVLKNAGYLDDEEQQLRKELLTVEDLLKTVTDPAERDQYKNKMTNTLRSYQALLAKKRIQVNSSVFKQYQRKIEEKFL